MPGFDVGQFGNVAGGVGLGLATQLAGNVLNGLVQNQFDKNTYNRSIGYYQMTRQDALNDWNAQNEYNSPKNQMQRLKEAGISPYSVSGQSVIGANTAQQTRGSNANTPSGYQVNSNMNNLMMINQAKLLNAQINQVNEQTRGNKIVNDDNERWLQPKSNAAIWSAQAQEEYIKASTEEKRAMLNNMKEDLESKTLDNAQKRLEAIYSNDMLKGKRDLLNKHIQQVQSQTDSIRQQIAKMKTITPFEVSKISQEIQRLRNENEKGAMENVMYPDYLHERNRAQKQQNDNMPSRHEAEMKRWLDTGTDLLPFKKLWDRTRSYQRK